MTYTDMTWEEFRAALIDFIGFEPRYPENARVKTKSEEAHVSPWEFEHAYCYDEHDRLLFMVNNGINPKYGVNNAAPFEGFPCCFALYARDETGEWAQEIRFDYIPGRGDGFLDFCCTISPYRFDDQGNRLPYTFFDTKCAWFKRVAQCEKNC